MSSPRLQISVVICAYSAARWHDLGAAVDSVSRQDEPPCEIIVVIDHNSEMLQRVRSELSHVVAIENREEQGLSGARNSGIRASRGEVVAFLDDDAIAQPDWLHQLAAGYSRGDPLGVGGRIEPIWLSGAPPWFPLEFGWVVGCSYRGMPATDAPVRNLIGANMSFRREVFERVGGFRHGVGRVGTLPVGCEETELCIRAQKQWPERAWLYRPDAVVQHRVPAARARLTYFLSRCFSEGLSKALVSALVGAESGLASERAYTVRTLPSGVVRGLSDMLLRRNPWGAARSTAITIGLFVTAMGYLIGKARGAGKDMATLAQEPLPPPL